MLRDLPLAGLEHFARRMMSRKAAALARMIALRSHRVAATPAMQPLSNCIFPSPTV